MAAAVPMIPAYICGGHSRECYCKGYVLPGRCADLKKKVELTENYFFLYTIYQCVPFKDAFHSGHPHPISINKPI